MMPVLRGVFVPHVTPFDERYGINGELLRELIHCFEDAVSTAS